MKQKLTTLFYYKKLEPGETTPFEQEAAEKIRNSKGLYSISQEIM